MDVAPSWTPRSPSPTPSMSLTTPPGDPLVMSQTSSMSCTGCRTTRGPSTLATTLPGASTTPATSGSPTMTARCHH
ncbi:hypothetical protein GBAR_LOCUS27401 [Geodia barretti]|uniref:Uncharacterized protein n=1 Tax=Geodia barretti TaxID=519541 RepID=A0AA35X8W2_GEOBA|nr:hypothetical protein GBAR_LOCUS27401 [Geodia barretti]